MNIIKSSAIFLLTLTVPFSAMADDSKLKRDVTYSASNYKQPNKAAAAQQWELRPQVTVRPVDTRQLALSHYKHLQGKMPVVAGIEMLQGQHRTIADRNYKTHYMGQNESTTASDGVAKHKEKSAGSEHTTKGE